MEKKKCSNCGNTVNKDDLFCQKCGTKIEKEEVVVEEKTKAKAKKEEPVEEYYVPPKKKGKAGKIIVTIIILILLAIIAILSFLLLNKDSKEEEKEKKPKEEEKIDDKKEEKPKEDDKKEEIHRITVYSKGDTFEFEGTEVQKVAEVPANGKTIEVFDLEYIYDLNDWTIDTRDKAYLLYRDSGKIYLYSKERDKRKVVDIEPDHDSYQMIYDTNKQAVIGIEYRDGDKYNIDEYGQKTIKQLGNSGLFNLKTGKKLYDGERYIDFYYISNNKLSATKLNSDYSYLVDFTYEKEYLAETSNISDTECEYNVFRPIGEYFLAVGKAGCVGYDNIKSATIYDKNINPIVRNVDSYFADEYKNKLYFYKDNTIYEYDENGNKLNDKYISYKTLDVIKNYFLIVKDNTLMLTDIDGNEYQLGEWKDNYFYHIMISGYYEKNQLTNEQEKKEGIYLIVETDTSGRGVEYYFDIVNHSTKKYELDQIGGYAKPVLYLYPEEETKVTVTFDKDENLTTTYPKYTDKWEVVAKPNGDLYDNNGKYYYGLYWEENLNHKVDFSTGFYVEKEDAIEFLEEKLTQIGLNDREKNEFIMYWLPILEKNEKNLVYFELTEERDQNSKLNISPTPDSILRVAIHVKKVNEITNIIEEKLPTFERKGFTAVEWGGVLY